MIRGIIFDLDGTLTYTLQDLCDSTNHALREMGWPERTLEEVRCFVGNGVHRLIERAVPSDATDESLEKCFSIFQRHYLVHCQDHTCLYPGVEEMLREVKNQGLRTAIVSNKLQPGVDELYGVFFRNLIDVAIGEQEGIRRKPAPDMVETALARLSLNRSDVVYVGDSEVDVETARNAQLPCISVLWGFRDRAQLEEAGATVFISHPKELLPLLQFPD